MVNFAELKGEAVFVSDALGEEVHKLKAIAEMIRAMDMKAGYNPLEQDDVKDGLYAVLSEIAETLDKSFEILDKDGRLRGREHRDIHLAGGGKGG